MQNHPDFRRLLLNPVFDTRQSALDTQKTPVSFAHPYGQRLSEYEQLTLYNQPNPDWIGGGLGLGGWTTHFPGGRGPWENYFTEARTVDWFAFRDPEGLWERPYVSQKADDWRTLQRNAQTAGKRAYYQQIDADWLWKVLDTHATALAFHDYALFMAHGAPIRDVLSDALRNVTVNAAFDYLDSAQTLIAHRVYLDKSNDDFSADPAIGRETWDRDARWQGARHLVQELWGNASYDHVEILFAIHAIHEPLFGRHLRDDFLIGNAARHGDHLSAQILSASIRGAERAQSWARELFFRTLAQDPEYGDYNRTLFAYWARKWLPLEAAALRDISPLWQSTATLDGADGRQRHQARLAHTVAQWHADWGGLMGDAARHIDVPGLAGSGRAA